MAAVSLGRATVALWREPSVQVSIPHLMSMPRAWSEDKTFVRFAGDKYPTSFYGEGEELTFALSCRYGAAEHVDLLALMTLLKVTRKAQPDRRLLLRTHIGLASGLDTSLAVEIDGPVADIPGEAFTVDVSFTARVVQHSFFA